jgi:hypothetical protein
MASTSLRDDLQQQIEAGQVVAIVGAGVSVGATNSHGVASWQGLLHQEKPDAQDCHACYGKRQSPPTDSQQASHYRYPPTPRRPHWQ